MTPELACDVAKLNAVTDRATARRMVKRATFHRVNARRADLIRARSRIDLSDAVGAIELEQLQEVVFRFIDLAFPRESTSPSLAELDQLEQQLAAQNGVQ